MLKTSFDKSCLQCSVVSHRNSGISPQGNHIFCMASCFHIHTWQHWLSYFCQTKPETILPVLPAETRTVLCLQVLAETGPKYISSQRKLEPKKSWSGTILCTTQRQDYLQQGRFVTWCSALSAPHPRRARGCGTGCCACCSPARCAAENSPASASGSAKKNHWIRNLDQFSFFSRWLKIQNVELNVCGGSFLLLCCSSSNPSAGCGISIGWVQIRKSEFRKSEIFPLSSVVTRLHLSLDPEPENKKVLVRRGSRIFAWLWRAEVFSWRRRKLLRCPCLSYAREITYRQCQGFMSELGFCMF